MSTKIYGGLISSAPIRLLMPLLCVYGMRAYHERVTGGFARYRATCDDADSQHAKDRFVGFAESHESSQLISDSEHDYSTKICLSEHRGKTYAICFEHRNIEPSMRGWLCDAGYMSAYAFREFRYWNSTDAPEGISSREWDERRDVWKQVLPSGIPAHDMQSVVDISHRTIDVRDMLNTTGV